MQGFCRDCGQFICKPCLDTHCKWKELRSHEISSLDNSQKAATKMVTPKQVSKMCAKHPTEPIKIYCETCEELICRDCTVKIHRNHDYDLITAAFPKHQSSILSYLQPIKAELAGVTNTIMKLKTRSSRLDGQIPEAKARVDAQVRVCALPEAHRRRLYSEIDSMVRQKKKDYVALIEFRQAQLSSCIEFVEGRLQNDTQEEVLSIKKQVEHITRQIAAELKHQYLRLSPEEVLCVSCTNQTPNYPSLAGVKFESVKFECTHIKTISGINEPRQIAFATTGEMVVCEWYENVVKVFNCSHELLKSFGSNGSEQSRVNMPVGIAISSYNVVFVVSSHCVKKFTLEGQLIASLGSQQTSPLRFDTPWAIAYNDSNNRLYVCDPGNRRIAILNHDLTFHGSFGWKGTAAGPSQFDPNGISVDGRGNVLVADYANNRVQVFNADGHYKSSITHTTLGKSLQGPISVAVGPDDWVCVAEYSISQVSVFDENHKYVKSFGKWGHKDGEFNDPYDIAVNDDGHVYVSDTRNNRVQVFK